MKITLKLLFVLMFLLSFISEKVYSQTMEDAKWWMGAKAGVNFTRPEVSNPLSILENLNSSSNNNSKEYNSIFKNAGPSLGVILTYSVTPRIAISVQPGYTGYQIGYSTKYQWKDTLANNYTIANTFNNKLHYVELPLLLKYEYSFGKLQPYLQIGAYYGFLLNGKIHAKSEEQFKNSTIDVTLSTRYQDFNANELFIKSLFGIIGGGGVSFDVNFFRIALDCNYRYGFNNVTNRKNRLEEQSMINGFYNVIDDIKLQNIEFTLHCTTPLDYLIHTPGMSGRVGKVRKR
jgi:hypothetical protein